MEGLIDLRHMHPGRPFEVGPFKGGIHPPDSQHHRIRSVGTDHAARHDSAHGRLQVRSDAHRDSRPSDLHTLADYGRRGVLALFSDSTNAERPGVTPSERGVSERFAEIMAEAKHRVLISCFSTSMHRLRIIADLAHEYGRRLCFVGRSMFRNSEIAMEMGLLRIPEGVLIQPQDIKKLPPRQVAAVLAGSQGEPMSARCGWR